LPDSGDEVTFEAGESSAPGGVFRYSWQFNEEGGDSTPVETSLPTVTHTFLEPGTYTVALTVFAQDGTSIGAARTVSVGILPAPTVTKVSPRTGPPAGGRTVKIIGTRLLGTTAVHFGTRTAAFKIESATTILAVSPAGSTGPVAITVTSPDGTSASTPADTFTYSQPTVSEVSPSSGPLAGGSSVTVTGSGFSPGSTTFTFGRVLAPAVECASTTSCTVTVPPGGTAGQVQVIATVAGRRSRKSGTGDLYTYL
jgi:hypothetical protein